MGPNDTVAVVEAVANAPQAPCFLVIDPMDPAKRDYILFDAGSTATSFTASSIDNRYLEGSAASGGITHDAGAIVRMSPLKQHIDDLNQRIDSRLSAEALTRELIEALGVRHNLLGNLDVGDPHPQYLNSARHTAEAHSFTLQASPAGRRITIGSSPHSNPTFLDIWVDTS